jgi:hypothetical protein
MKETFRCESGIRESGCDFLLFGNLITMLYLYNLQGVRAFRPGLAYGRASAAAKSYAARFVIRLHPSRPAKVPAGPSGPMCPFQLSSVPRLVLCLPQAFDHHRRRHHRAFDRHLRRHQAVDHHRHRASPLHHADRRLHPFERNTSFRSSDLLFGPPKATSRNLFLDIIKTLAVKPFANRNVVLDPEIFCFLQRAQVALPARIPDAL